VDYTEPSRTPDAAPPTDAEAETNVQAVFGDAIAWERAFDRHTDFDGTPVWIERSTGEVYKELPRMSPKDGTNL
jgi:hypothetical protein